MRSVYFKKHFLILGVFLLAIILRLALTPLAFHVDILSNAGWGEWIFNNGEKGFYENNIWLFSWPTQPPLVNSVYMFAYQLYLWLLELLRQSANIIVWYHLAPGHMVWFFNFVIWFDDLVSPTMPFPYGFLISIKLIAIFADIAIGAGVYWFAKQSKNNPILWSSVYLFSPFSWYLSALWGQYDQIAYLFSLMSFLSIVRFPILAPLLLVISISLKPTTAIFLPVFTWLYLKRSPDRKAILFGALAAILFLYLTLSLYTSNNIGVFIKDVLIPKIIFKSEFRVSTNAYNFWHILTLDKAMNHSEKFLFIPAKVWGLLAFAYINFKTFRSVKKITYEKIIAAMFLVGAGGWLFLTNMLDRYLFAGLVSGLFVVINRPKLFKYWLIMSLVFWINLYRNWWYPEFMFPVKNLLTLNGGIMGALLGSINVYMFIMIAKNILKVKN